ncbi:MULTISPECIES: DEAD/DEAH box helicase [unclassified Flavobacterium]|uniref:DEAD/DEAH box helicase n=1 Tax=unclassified Flavobacterium TaxID=196869 RepID=UPI0013D58DF6|nr:MULTISPECIES: DEAD/DEAH box helicase [unclassified Flavobacterium]MBA5792509.1 DEAD/DEAH box helicase [Flavobacterium sp. xlx-221]
MNLKKINSHLQQALIDQGKTEAPNVIAEAFGTIKSGNDVVLIIEDEEERETTIALSVIQRLEKAFMLSPRALVVVEDKPQALKMEQVFKDLAKYTNLRIFMTHDKTDLDEDKNQISLGIDVLIGTPDRLSFMFGNAGFDVNQLKMWVVNNTDDLLKKRQDAKLYRLSESIGKTQRLYVSSQETERLEVFVDKTMLDSYWFSDDEFEDRIDE